MNENLLDIADCEDVYDSNLKQAMEVLDNYERDYGFEDWGEHNV